MASALGGLSEGGKNVLGGPVEIRERAGRLQHSGKFIAADAKRRVWCNRGSNPLTRNLQETVAGIMAESVVHHLQIVQIDDEQSRSEEHTSELQSLMRISYAVFCLKK